MKKRIITGLAIIIVSLSINQSWAQITNEYDKSVDFTQYKSFKFIEWTVDSSSHISELDKERILSAFENELNSRNIISNNESPDMAITLYLVVEGKTIKDAYNPNTGNPAYAKSYGYGGYSNTSYSEEYYEEGTIIVNFFDEKEKNLIWEGVLVTRVKQKPKKREKSIPEKIRKLMYNYPIKPVKK